MSDRHVNRYAAYKESGVEWLREVPEDWSFVRIKNVISKITSGVTPRGGAESYVDVGIPFLRSQNVHNEGLHIDDVSFISVNTHQEMMNSQVRPGDIVFNITGASIARTCIIPTTLKIANISQHIALLRLRNANEPKFIWYYLQSQFVKDYVYLTQSGASKEAFNHGQMKCIPLPLPPLPEQTAIAAYLDTKTAQIDRQIELLNKKATQHGKLKQSLINETVTRGLDSTVPMKESGVEWIGEVPAHWEMKRLKEAFNERSQKGYPKEPLLIASQTHGVTLKSSYSRNTMTVQNDFHLMKLVNKNDFVISLRSFEGGIEISAQRGIISAAYTILTSATNEAARYYKHLFKSTRFISLLVTCTTGIREGRNVNYQQLKRELLPAPPISEQTAIAAYLDTKTAKIDRIVSTINTQIDKLKELRKTLINDVVTGKIKVIPHGELA
jgi:type I restriction enzyme S subunit